MGTQSPGAARPEPPPSSGCPGPGGRGKGSLNATLRETLLRLGSDGEASREKLSPCVSGILPAAPPHVASKDRELPPRRVRLEQPWPEPITLPPLQRGEAGTGAVQRGRRRRDRMPGHFPLYSSGMVSQAEASCQLYVLPVTPKNGTPIGRWRWPSPPGNVAQLPQTHSLGAKGCGMGELNGNAVCLAQGWGSDTAPNST